MGGGVSEVTRKRRVGGEEWTERRGREGVIKEGG